MITAAQPSQRGKGRLKDAAAAPVIVTLGVTRANQLLHWICWTKTVSFLLVTRVFMRVVPLLYMEKFALVFMQVVIC